MNIKQRYIKLLSNIEEFLIEEDNMKKVLVCTKCHFSTDLKSEKEKCYQYIGVKTLLTCISVFYISY